MNGKRYTFLDLGTVNRPYAGALKEAVCRVIDSGRFIGGPEVEAFERSMAALCGTARAVGVSNGLDALRLIFRAYVELGVMRPGDEVIVPGNTFIASVLAVSDCGLVPVFVEPDPLTMDLDTSLVEAAVTPRTRAVMPVHLYGRVCYDATLRDAAARHGLKIVEDSAQAIGALSATPGRGGSRRAGALGDAAAFSFYPTKNIGALGDAGAVTTDDATLADAIRQLANYGSDRQYHNIYKGLNCRLDPMQAAILSAKLPFTDRENDARRRLAAVYEARITNPAVTKPLYTDDGSAVWHQYVVRVDDREAFRSYLADRGVETGVHYPVAPFDQPCYKEFGGLDMPLSRRLAATVVSLPVSACTSEDDAREISEIINSYKTK